MKNLFDLVVNFLKSVFSHKRMVAFYWSAVTMFVAELTAVLPEVLVNFHAPQWLVIGIGLALAQVTKVLNTPKDNVQLP